MFNSGGYLKEVPHFLNVQYDHAHEYLVYIGPVDIWRGLVGRSSARFQGEEVDTSLQQNAKVALLCKFYEECFREGVTKNCKSQRKLLAGSINRASHLARPLIRDYEKP